MDTGSSLAVASFEEALVATRAESSSATEAREGDDEVNVAPANMEAAFVQQVTTFYPRSLVYTFPL
jgi:hypothetical protein